MSYLLISVPIIFALNHFEYMKEVSISCPKKDFFFLYPVLDSGAYKKTVKSMKEKGEVPH